MKLKPSLTDPWGWWSYALRLPQSVPVISGHSQTVSDMCPQPSLSATATVRCLLLAQEPLEKASLLCCSLLDVGVHPDATSQSFCSCQAFRQRLGEFVAQNLKSLPRKNSDFRTLSFQFYIFRRRPRGHVTNAMNQSFIVYNVPGTFAHTGHTVMNVETWSLPFWSPSSFPSSAPRSISPTPMTLPFLAANHTFPWILINNIHK